jgi:hypothetical protein
MQLHDCVVEERDDVSRCARDLVAIHRQMMLASKAQHYCANNAATAALPRCHRRTICARRGVDFIDYMCKFTFVYTCNRWISSWANARHPDHQ